MQENYAPTSLVACIAGLGQVALKKGDLELAGLLWGAVLAHAEHLLGFEGKRWVVDVRTETRPEFLAALERGRELELRDAAVIALVQTGPDAS